MAEFNENGGLEISPGPRGFSLIGFEVSEDGEQIRGVTNQPGFTNWVPMPRGPRGFQGDFGDPGESRIRIDDVVGHRVFLWDVRTAGENMIYGDTGTWTLDDGTTTVRRSNNTVETNAADPSTLPIGFRPEKAGSTGHYLTNDPWPEMVEGTITTPPQDHRGLEGYVSAVAQGYPGTAEDWMNMTYRVVLPEGGTNGQVLTRTASGSAWLPLPIIGPGAWTNITLNANWRNMTGRVAMIRHNNGTVELIGDVEYTGPSTTTGVWGSHFVTIGSIPPGYAPEGQIDVPVRVFRGDETAGHMNYPVPGRVVVNTNGVISLGAFRHEGENFMNVEPRETQVSFSSITWPLRNSPNV